ncbi:hypothetical protein E2C01_045985 [Portunus trituberculatus]|uniref:Uncharacterized protein n=1 Tax=Portunus trituberculatus TaxID=210409 RepID=A0A5B7G6E7_PORTR|nr:hypothetical protein [Portunus trituberculatus]
MIPNKSIQDTPLARNSRITTSNPMDYSFNANHKTPTGKTLRRSIPLSSSVTQASATRPASTCSISHRQTSLNLTPTSLSGNTFTSTSSAPFGVVLRKTVSGNANPNPGLPSSLDSLRRQHLPAPSPEPPPAGTLPRATASLITAWITDTFTYYRASVRGDL